MTHSSEPFVVAAVQGSPVFLDRKATLDKACSLITEAGAKGARLVVFPEGYLPGYPFWVWFIPSGNTKALRDLYVEILDNSVSVPDRLAFKEEFLPSELEWINPGGSAIGEDDG
ncbi:MAG: nitrilase-related carbon-nitrogen hydrolase [Thermoanaerobaculia bacterium]